MLRGTTLGLMVLMVALALTPRAHAQANVATVTGGGNPGNPDNPKPSSPSVKTVTGGGNPGNPDNPSSPKPNPPSGNSGVPKCPLPGDNGASTTFAATYNGKSAACYNVGSSIRNCECPDNFKLAACCKGSETCTTDQTTKCTTCCKSPAGK